MTARASITNLTKLDRAEAIREVLQLRDAADRLLDILMPEQTVDGCPHPADKIQDLSTMDDGGELYRCTACGEQSSTPFLSIIDKE